MVGDGQADFLVVIPARYQSTRLPGKPLVEIDGVPMIVRTFEQCAKAVARDKIIIATDDARIGAICDANNLGWLMTAENCLTGTDRVADVARQTDHALYINVQGDEPVFNPDDVQKLIAAACADPLQVMCGYTEITEAEDYHSTACPKVVTALDGRLLYMTRAGVPGNKTGQFEKAWRQVCAYSFPRDPLLAYADYDRKTPIEEIEDIEILRFLELGHSVHMLPMSAQSIPVDFPEDVAKVEAALKAGIA